MKVAFIAPYVPNSIRCRPYNFLLSLNKIGHQIVLFTLWSDSYEIQSLQHLESCGIKVEAVELPFMRTVMNSLQAFPTSNPLQYKYAWQPALFDRFTQYLENHPDDSFDVIHIEHLRGAFFGIKILEWLESKHLTIPIVWDSVDSISYLFRQAAQNARGWKSRLITRFEAKRTEKIEKFLVDKFDKVLVTSAVDKKVFDDLCDFSEDKKKIQIIPNGVDLDYFIPDPVIERRTADLVISGKMSYHANVSMVLNFIENILPIINEKRPDLHLWVVGKDPANAILKYKDHKSITVTGTVDEMRPYLQRSTISVSPTTYGAGIQNKVLEAMACGTPVVASSKAVAALEVNHGEQLMVADDPELFANHVLTLLSDSALRESISRTGLAYVQKNHCWTNIAQSLEQTYIEVIA